MIKLSNGHCFSYLTASGAMGYDGEGWFWERYGLRPLGCMDMDTCTHVTKTITLQPWSGNFRWYRPWSVIRFINDGVVNAFGLTNPGLDWWENEVGQKIERQKLIVSITSFILAADEIMVLASHLADYQIVGVEYNASCPNKKTSERFTADTVLRHCEAVKRHCCHPLLFKGGVTSDWDYLLPRLRGIAEAINLNSVPWIVAFPGQKSPLARYGGGGVSGKAAQPHNWPLIKRLQGLTDIPVIGCSAWEENDMDKLLTDYHVPAIALGAICLRHPVRATRMLHNSVMDQLAVV